MLTQVAVLALLACCNLIGQGIDWLQLLPPAHSTIYSQRLHFIMSSKDLKAAADKKRNSLKSEAKKEIKALRNEDKRRLRVESDPTYQVDKQGSSEDFACCPQLFEELIQEHLLAFAKKNI